MFIRKYVFACAILLLTISVALAQTDTCPELVEQALDATDQACQDLDRNEVCYGNIQNLALDSSGEEMQFQQAGDQISILDMASLTTFPMNVEEGTWGVAVMKLQANIPNSIPGQNVTFVLFGDVKLENDNVNAEAVVTLSGNPTNRSNARTGPGTNFAIVGKLNPDTPVTVTGRNANSTWLQIQLDGQTAWVSSQLLKLDGDMHILPERETGQTAYNAPMQAFSFETGIGQAACDEAPRDGLLIQSPEGITVNFLINGVDVTVGSTALIRETGTDLVQIFNLAGHVKTQPDKDQVALEPGQVVAVKAGEAPGEVGTYTLQDLQSLPLNLLPEEVSIPPVITNIEAKTTVNNAPRLPMPIHFINADGDVIVSIYSKWTQEGFEATETEINLLNGDFYDGTLSYERGCRSDDGSPTTNTAIYTLDVVITDEQGNSSPPFEYSYTCLPG